MKTANEIERDFYMLIKGSELGAAVRGTLYRSGMRPKNAKGEDLIVKFLAGSDEQIETGTVVLNIYVPDIEYSDGRKVEDKGRVGELEQLILNFVRDCKDTDYLIKTDGKPYSTDNPDIEQHLIVARLKFQRLNQE